MRNTGSHLTPDECARVFDRFYRTDPARQRSTGGTGLGLSIVKHLVEAHGGRVWAESSADEVAFHVALPARSRSRYNDAELRATSYEFEITRMVPHCGIQSLAESR